MPGNYSAYASHPWHHAFAMGYPSLLGLLFPFLVLGIPFLLLLLARWAEHQAETRRRRRKVRAARSRALVLSLQAAGPVLASDSERDGAIRMVSHAIGEGRLSIEEGGERIDALLRGRHRHELADLVKDLPSLTPAVTARSSAMTLLGRGALIVAAALILASVVAQAALGVWELWPAAVVALGTSVAVTRPTAHKTKSS